jgi:hypothetical protein
MILVKSLITRKTWKPTNPEKRDTFSINLTLLDEDVNAGIHLGLAETILL